MLLFFTFFSIFSSLLACAKHQSNNTKLTFLVCEDNQISSLDVSNNTALETFFCGNSQLSSLDVSNNTALTGFGFSNSSITNIDVSNNTSLVFLSLFNNQLTSLDVSNNILLTTLVCSQNQLSTLDISNNTALKILHCGWNQITNLDVSNNTDLQLLHCEQNQFATLDLSNNPSLIALACGPNQLTSLNVKNGNNINFTSFDLRSNPGLTCIQVDDAAWSTANWTNIDAHMYFSEDCNGGGGAYTPIPDPNFEQALIDLGLDDVMDGQVLKASIENVTSLQIENKDIADLTGIEAFTLLEELIASNNPLGVIDISMNQKLRNVILYNCELTSINVANNPELWSLGCAANLLTEIDVTNNLLLEGLSAHHNQLMHIDLSNNAILKGLQIHDNKFTEIDLSHNPMLSTLSLHYNPLLNSLNLKNGGNQNINLIALNNCPNLTCIQVDDSAWSTANWTQIDPQSYFSEFCGGSVDDTDGDGVPDYADDYPNDPGRAFDNYFPATGFGSLAFEDLWPGKGDYDFNDLVVDYRFQTVTNASNRVVEVLCTFVVKASGASLQNGFGFSLPDGHNEFITVPSKLMVSGYRVTEPFIELLDNGFEQGQSKPTIIVFDDVFNVLPHPGGSLGINTDPQGVFVPFETISISMIPTGLDFYASDFSFETWNPFMIVDRNRGMEVHLPDYPPTDLADLSLLGTYEDDSDPSAGRYYKTANNLPWAINIASTFTWPNEKVNITEAYSHFVAWAQSAGLLYNDWYLDKPGYRNDDRLYEVP
jgi:LruC domain-containing protein